MKNAPFQSLQLFANRIEVSANLGGVKTRQYLKEYARYIGNNELLIDAGSGKSPSPYIHYFDAERILSFDLYNKGANFTANICMIPLANAVAGGVICTEVLEHVPDTKLALGELYRIIEPGGYLILTVPLVGGVHQNVDFYRWTNQGLRQIIEEHDFEIISLGKRGGVFSCIGHFIHAVPFQLFGPLEREQGLIRNALYIIFAALTIPIPWFLSIFDFLDQKKNYTLGYALLLQKIQ